MGHSLGLAHTFQDSGSIGFSKGLYNVTSYGFGQYSEDLIMDYKVAKDGSSQNNTTCLLYTSPSPRDGLLSRMPSSA